MARPSSVLGVPRGASPRQIKHRWHEILFENHPDRVPEAERARANARFAILSDAHDRLEAGDDRDLDDAAAPRPHRGADVSMIAPVRFLDAVVGGEVDVLGPAGETYSVKIPAGAATGLRLRLAGRGGGGFPPGDLLLQVLVLDDALRRDADGALERRELYSRDGDALQRVQDVTWLAAWRGDLVSVETPWGRTHIQLQAGARDGQVYEIPGHGIRAAGASRGPLRLRLRLLAPLARHRLPAETAYSLEIALEAAFASPEEGL